MSLSSQARAAGLDPSRLTYQGKSLDDVEEKPKSRYKSKLEQRFAWELESRQKIGLVTWWAYEPVTLVIVDAGGKRCRYTADFVAQNNNSDLIFYECKGFLREAARIRFLAAKERYPFWTFKMIHLSKYGQSWEELL